jgi:hypothetical protein
VYVCCRVCVACAILMKTPDEYRTMADKCLSQAREAETESERRLYLNLAKVWLEAALNQDSAASALRLPPVASL